MASEIFKSKNSNKILIYRRLHKYELQPGAKVLKHLLKLHFVHLIAFKINNFNAEVNK